MPMHDLTCDHPKPIFSRMHYEALAEWLREHRPEDKAKDPNQTWSEYLDFRQWQHLIRETAIILRQDNHLFDYPAFQAASNYYGDNPTGYIVTHHRTNTHFSEIKWSPKQIGMLPAAFFM